MTWLRQARWNAEPPPDTRDPYANLPNARDLPEPEDHPFDPPEWMAEKLAELEAKRAAS